MEKTNFENLQIYQLAERLADEIWHSAVQWPNLARDMVGKQAIRAADGVGANIAEGSGRGSPVDNRRFLRMARGTLYETRHWLRRAYCRKLLEETKISTLTEIISELTPKLNAYLRAVDDTIKSNLKDKLKDKS